ncbi:unnamed protein product [Cuscuta campestris]|uniref:Uncharacterized protein n=1 Tax=Cuscuta campestris TaxID=132261 RepID=A0A484KTD4_9ASTE|nr:unnamed protein product [Cuscuta campestris]
MKRSIDCAQSQSQEVPSTNVSHDSHVETVQNEDTSLSTTDWIRAQLCKPKLDMEENLEELEKMEKDLKNANIDDDLIFVTE